MNSRELTISRRRALQLLAIGPGSLVVAACGGAAQSPAAPVSATVVTATTPVAANVAAPTAAAGAPRTGGTLRALQAGDLASLDGHYYTTGNGLSVWLI